jgi:hypothetical protein
MATARRVPSVGKIIIGVPPRRDLETLRAVFVRNRRTGEASNWKVPPDEEKLTENPAT